MTTTSSKSIPLTLAAMVIIIVGVSYAASIINPLLMALFAGTILAQPIKWLRKHKVPHWVPKAVLVQLGEHMHERRPLISVQA